MVGHRVGGSLGLLAWLVLVERLLGGVEGIDVLVDPAAAAVLHYASIIDRRGCS